MAPAKHFMELAKEGKLAGNMICTGSFPDWKTSDTVAPQVHRQSVTWPDCFHEPPAGHPLPNDFGIFCVICCDSWTNRRPSSAAICIRCEAHFVHVSSASGTERTPLILFAKSDHRETSDCTRASQARLA